MDFGDIIEDMKFWNKMFKKSIKKPEVKGKKVNKNKKKNDDFLKNLPPGDKDRIGTKTVF